LIAKENKGFGSLNIPKNWPKLTVQGHVKGKRGASNDYSVDELKAMVALLQGHAQDEALFALCTGMRAGELENIRLEHFTPRTDMPGCAGTLYVPPGHEDHPRDVGVTHGMWAILQRALPFSIDHKRVYATAIKKVTGKSKFGLRDFRAGFISALAPIDTYGGHMAAGHTSGVMGRYHNWTPDRMATVALAAWGIFAPGGHGGQLGAKMGAIGYARKRLKS
jgi:integrase